MSWSVSVIGVPEKVNAKLDEYGAGLTGQSQQEFNEAKPHLQALISQNVASNIVVKIDASGHATFAEGKKTYGNCSVTLTQFYSQLVL